MTGSFEDGTLSIIAFEVTHVCSIGVSDIIETFNSGELVVSTFGLFVIGRLYRIKSRKVFESISPRSSSFFSLMILSASDSNRREGLSVKVGFFVVFNVISGVL